MATIKLKFRPSSVPKAEGTLYYQVIHKRKVKWISTEHHIYANEWDEKTETIVVVARSERKAVLALMQCKIDWTLKRWQTILDRMECSHKDILQKSYAMPSARNRRIRLCLCSCRNKCSRKSK